MFLRDDIIKIALFTKRKETAMGQNEWLLCKEDWGLLAAAIERGEYVPPVRCLVHNHEGSIGIVISSISIHKDRITIYLPEKETFLVTPENLYMFKVGADKEDKRVVHRLLDNNAPSSEEF